MHIDAVQRQRVLRQGVEPRLGGAPVEAVMPVADQLLHVSDVAAIRPGLARRLVGKARARQPLAQIGDRRIRHVQRAGNGLAHRGRSRSIFR
jgi:hypothetical protein